MGARAAKAAAILAASVSQWWESDALFAWSPFTDTDAAVVDPLIGGTLSKRAASATPGAKSWDMTGACYTNTTSTGLTAAIDATLPFLVVVIIDKNNQTSTSFPVLVQVGSAAIYVEFQTNASVQPRFQVQLTNGTTFTASYITQTTWSAKGTLAAHWIYCNPSDATNTFVAGVNQTTTTSSGVVSTPGGTVPRGVAYGNAVGATSALSSCLHGLVQVVGNRSGANALTLTQAKAIVQKMQNAGL